MYHSFQLGNPRTLIHLLAMLAVFAAPLATVAGAPPPTRTFIPIGAGYTSISLQRFAQAAVQRDTDGQVYLLVLPITYGTNAYSTTNGERNKNLTLADTRRGQIQTACEAVKQPGQTCRTVLVPMLIRADAYLQSNLDLFNGNVDGMYILGGDQTIGMQVVADTPAEQRMAAAYAAGAVVSGNSAGDAVQSLNMIAGYIGNNGPEDGLKQGSVDLWTSKDVTDYHRGLIFGLPNVILEQHTYQRGRIGRMINAVWSTSLLGVGADADTAAAIQNESSLTDVIGETSAFIVDLETFGATGRYAGPSHTLAIHRVATHVLPPGGYGYDLAKRRPVVNGMSLLAPVISGRSFNVKLPAGYGPLLLGGDIRGDMAGLAAQRFVALAGGTGARLVVITTGYVQNADAQADAKALAAAFQSQVTAPVQWFVLDSHADLTAIQAAVNGATGVFLTAPDQSTVSGALNAAPSVLQAIRSAWQGGKPFMADNAAAAALGKWMSANPTPTSSSREDDAMNAFLSGEVNVVPGLGWVNGVAVEPRLLPDYRWGRLYSLLAKDATALAWGVDVNTAVEVNQAGAVARGESAALVLDGRAASFGVGTNGALGAQYVVLDSYVDGDAMVP